MYEMLRNYTDLDLIHLFEDVESEANLFHLADMHCNYYDVQHVLPDQFCHTRFQHKVLHLNIQGVSSKYGQLQILLSQLPDANIELIIYYCGKLL